MFLSALNEFIALIRPIVPIETRSSMPIPVFSNFFEMYTTSLKLCSMSIFLLFVSVFIFEIASASSDGDRGGGSVSGPFM